MNDPLTAIKYTLRSLKTQMREPMAKPIEKITLPIMFISGDNDALFSSPYTRSLYERIHHKKKKIVFVKDAAHLLFHESTQVLVEEMKKFIQNII